MYWLTLYLKLGLIIAPLLHLYNLWDHRRHPVVMPGWEPTRAIEHFRGLVLAYITWPLFLPLVIIGWISAMLFYLRYGVWPP